MPFTLYDVARENSGGRPWTPHLAAQELFLDLQNVQILGELVVDLRARLGEKEAHFEVEMIRRRRRGQLLLQRLRRVQPSVGEILREIFDEQTEVFSLGRQIEIVEDFIEQIDAFATALEVFINEHGSVGPRVRYSHRYERFVLYRQGNE